jgi:hypothetical protein
VFYFHNPTSRHVTSLHIQVRAPLQPHLLSTHSLKSIANIYFSYSGTRVVCCSVISVATPSYFKGVAEISLRQVTLALPAIMARYPASLQESTFAELETVLFTPRLTKL